MKTILFHVQNNHVKTEKNIISIDTNLTECHP